MAYIRYVSSLDGGHQLSALHERLGDRDGDVDNILWIHSLNPPSMQHHFEMYRHLMRGPSPLTRTQREMVAVVVSTLNDCFY